MMNHCSSNAIPAWVPESALRYLAHTEAGYSIRELARTAGCHASTVLRQVRKFENRRDDPLVDAALQKLALSYFEAGAAPETADLDAAPTVSLPDGPEYTAEAMRILRRLGESGALLAVAEDLDMAVVVRDGGDGSTLRTATVACSVAQAMALQEWITCDKPGRISRYRITVAGRAALGQLVADAENRASREQIGERAEVRAIDTDARTRRSRYGVQESPLAILARRKNREGKPFLEEGLVRAGERLREDFELSQIGPHVTQCWESYLAQGDAPRQIDKDRFGAARARVSAALSDLGPGLSDVVLRCCCFLEGLEQAEKRMGWSARSGKIVLRIALQRLKRHYEAQAASDALIG